MLLSQNVSEKLEGSSMDLKIWNGLGWRKTLIVLGAGASRGASFVSDAYRARPPLDCDFFSELQRLKQETDVKELLYLVREEFGVDPTLSMEHFFSQVEYMNRFHQEFNIDPGRKKIKYYRMLERFYRSLPILFNQAIGNESCEYHERLVDLLHTNDVILSFNYDCLIDNALRNRAGKRWNPEKGYGFSVREGVSNWRAKRLRGRDAKRSISLLKPHGSLNWHINGTGLVTLEEKPYDIKSAEGRIIPPTLFKNIEEKPYKNIWEKIRREIRGCRALIVIGYSVPATDLFSRALFRADISSKIKREELEFLILVNPDHVARQEFVNLIRDGIKESTRIIEFDNLKEMANSLPSIKDGTIRWGSVSDSKPGNPHQHGRKSFRFGQGVQIDFQSPGHLKGYLYIKLPARTKPVKLLNEVGHDQIRSWRPIGLCEWRFNYPQTLRGVSPRYYTLTVRPTD